jgi:L-threonylcarbamoyladenylate synthase
VSPDPIAQALRWLRSGGLLAYPTETVWGLAADAASEESVERLRRWKGRGAEEPIAVLVESAEAAEALGFEFGRSARRLAGDFWPGPLTLVVSSQRKLARGIERDDGAVGLRCSSHPLAATLARRIGAEGVGPVTATSLNRSGEPAARSADEARACCGSGPDDPRLLDVEGAEAGGAAASTVVDVTGEHPEVLRWGALRECEVRPVLDELAAS